MIKNSSNLWTKKNLSTLIGYFPLTTKLGRILSLISGSEIEASQMTRKSPRRMILIMTSEEKGTKKSSKQEERHQILKNGGVLREKATKKETPAMRTKMMTMMMAQMVAK